MSDISKSMLRQALWDVFAICGGDTDGDRTPAGISDIHLAQMAVDCARDLRECYDEEIKA